MRPALRARCAPSRILRSTNSRWWTSPRSSPRLLAIRKADDKKGEQLSDRIKDPSLSDEEKKKLAAKLNPNYGKSRFGFLGRLGRKAKVPEAQADDLMGNIPPVRGILDDPIGATPSMRTTPLARPGDMGSYLRRQGRKVIDAEAVQRGLASSRTAMNAAALRQRVSNLGRDAETLLRAGGGDARQVQNLQSRLRALRMAEGGQGGASPVADQLAARYPQFFSTVGKSFTKALPLAATGALWLGGAGAAIASFSGRGDKEAQWDAEVARRRALWDRATPELRREFPLVTGGTPFSQAKMTRLFHTLRRENNEFEARLKRIGKSFGDVVNRMMTAGLPGPRRPSARMGSAAVD